MKSRHTIRLALLITALLLCVLISADSALAQCAMCRASFAGNSTFVRNFNLGVLVLLAPPVTIFCTIFVIAYRHRKG
jgi:hypothetical protein